MPRRPIDLRGKPLLDIASYARRGPGRRDRLSPDEIELIRRTVTRTPEVMVKVLTRGGQSLDAVRAHLAYLNRQGELELETDQGEQLRGKGVEKQLLEDWDLDVEDHRRRVDLKPGKDRSPPKLVHKILFSMPPGTPPRKVLQAVKNFAREEFGLMHRYAMVLHTDEPHPHVHVAVKAVSEQGVRLNIRRETLRRWRANFAAHLRALGVPANATERAVRGSAHQNLKEGIYRSAERGDSIFIRKRTESIAQEKRVSAFRIEAGKPRVLQTRRDVERGWLAFAEAVEREAMGNVADEIERFVRQMPFAQTGREAFAQSMRSVEVNQPSPVR